MPKQISPLLNQIKWIAISYFTRPLVLVMAGLGLLVTVVPLVVQPNTSMMGSELYPAMPRGKLWVDSQATLENVRAQGRQQEVDSIDLSRLCDVATKQRLQKDPSLRNVGFHLSAPDKDFYKVLNEFPNLRIVRDWCYTPSLYDLGQIARIPHLEYLTLEGAGVPNLAPLKAATKLHRLNWHCYDAPKRIEQLASLPVLETIAFNWRDSVDDTVLRGLAELPQLEVLILGFPDNPIPKGWPADKDLGAARGHPITRKGFEALAQAPRLKTIYAGGYPSSHRARFLSFAKGVDAHWQITQAVESPNPMAPMIWAGAFAFAMAIGAQLSQQFRSPFSKLSPGYVTSHALMAIILSSGAVLLCTLQVRSVITEGALLPAFTYAATIFTACLGSMSLSANVPTQLQGPKRLAHFGTLVFVCLLGLPNTEYGRQLLRGDAPVGLAVMALAGVLALALEVWLLSRLTFWSTDASPLSNKASLQEMAAMRFRGGWLGNSARGEQRIEQLPRGNETLSWWSRVQRWRAGNPTRMPLRYALMFFAWIMFFQFFMFWGPSGRTRSLLSLTPSMLRSSISMFALGVTAMGAMLVAWTWRARVRMLPLEILRPYSRRSIQMEWVAAFALDLLPISVVVAAMAAVLIHTNDNWQVHWQSVPLTFVAFLTFCLALTFGSGGVFIALRRTWLAITIVMGTLIVSQFGATLLLVYMFHDKRPSAMPGAMLQALPMAMSIPLLLNLLLAVVAWRAWKRLEIGMIA